MATVVVQQHQPPLRHSPTPPPLPPSISLHHPRSTTPIPNKHIPFCPPGPSRSPPQAPETPPQSPPPVSATSSSASLLYPVETLPRLSNWPSPVFSIGIYKLAAALDHNSRQLLPDSQQVFPWLHGLHCDNQVQLAFFVARKKSLRKTPRCLRGITLIKFGSDLTHSRLKGSIGLEEALTFSACSRGEREFLDCDPKEGFSVRNFHIQAAKLARISDIVLYGDESIDRKAMRALAESISSAQRNLKRELEANGEIAEQFHTFVLSTPFPEIAKSHPELIAVDADGNLTDGTVDFVQWERNEMAEMTQATEISQNVWLGPTPDWNLMPSEIKESAFDIYIETSDQALLPDDDYLELRSEQLECPPVHVEFPSSGSIMPPSWSSSEVDGLISTCKWIYNMTHSTLEEQVEDSDGDIQMTTFSGSEPTHRVLIHCADGYTESTLLAITYFMYAEGVPLHDAWLRLHREKQRNFFSYPADVALLARLQPRILAESPKAKPMQFDPQDISSPTWLSRLDGSLPSRILPYMYLGNLSHANNPGLLREIGIKRILSIGEPFTWSKKEQEEWGRANIMMISRVQDNGIDPLTEEFEKCLEFIGRGKIDSSATLVHCRVGVSRSATICIAEVMSSLRLSFPRAYCFVRARRLNVIIQPHLRFVYELMKWDEVQQKKRGEPVKREMEWQAIAREIAAMNKPYSRQ